MLWRQSQTLSCLGTFPTSHHKTLHSNLLQALLAPPLCPDTLYISPHMPWNNTVGEEEFIKWIQSLRGLWSDLHCDNITPCVAEARKSFHTREVWGSGITGICPSCFQETVLSWPQLKCLRLEWKLKWEPKYLITVMTSWAYVDSLNSLLSPGWAAGPVRTYRMRNLKYFWSLCRKP